MEGSIRLETYFDYIAALDGNSVAHVLVGRPFDVLLASFALPRWVELGGAGLHNSFGGWTQIANVTDHSR